MLFDLKLARFDYIYILGWITFFTNFLISLKCLYLLVFPYSLQDSGAHFAELTDFSEKLDVHQLLLFEDAFANLFEGVERTEHQMAISQAFCIAFCTIRLLLFAQGYEIGTEGRWS